MRLLRACLCTTLLSILIAGGCSGRNSPTEPSTPPPVTQASTPAPAPPPIAIVADAVMVGTGDIAECGLPEVQQTAQLVDGIAGTVFTTGDNVYPAGSVRDFEACYEPTWGRHKHRTRPSPGNHDYITNAGAPYYAYFGENAGPAGLGYYSYKEGAWLVLSLNSNVPAGPSSPQAAWVRHTLAMNEQPCTLAYWHYPLFSSGPNGSIDVMKHIWSLLYEANADVVLAGHDHLYERFAPQDADGRLDLQRGIRQFTVGTGGAHLYEPKTPKANSEVRGRAQGVLKLTLKADSYDWEFLPVPGKSFSDGGSARCH